MAPSKLEITPIAATIFELLGSFYQLCSSQCCPFVYISVAEWLMFSSHLQNIPKLKVNWKVVRTHSSLALLRRHIFIFQNWKSLIYAIVVKNISLCIHIFLFREGISLSNVISMENVGFAFIFCHFMWNKFSNVICVKNTSFFIHISYWNKFFKCDIWGKC